MCFKLQRNVTENWQSRRKDTFTERLSLQMTVLHKSILISKAGLWLVWEKFKDTVRDISDSNQDIKTSCMSKLKLSEVKYLYIKSSKKPAKDELYKTAMPEVWLRAFASNSQCL